MIKNLSSLEVEFQELSDNELETVVGGTYKRNHGYSNNGNGFNGGGVVINNNNNNNNR